MQTESELRYRKARFSTRLPIGPVYTPSHFWISQPASGRWRVGFTHFATRMLGEFVELDFSVAPGEAVSIGQEIGWVEGFKAVSDVFCVVDGHFVGGNPRLREDITLTETDPYGEGWLYEADGTPEGGGLDAYGYARLLDTTIDRMRGQDAENGDDAALSEGGDIGG